MLTRCTASIYARFWVFCIVITLAPLILIGSSSFLEETRITITSWMSTNFSQIRLWTAELAALNVESDFKNKNKKHFVVDSQVSDRCHWATCFLLCRIYSIIVIKNNFIIHKHSLGPSGSVKDLYALSFRLSPWDLKNVNEWKIMFCLYIVPIST